LHAQLPVQPRLASQYSPVAHSESFVQAIPGMHTQVALLQV
jgi:hypothetical protein